MEHGCRRKTGRQWNTEMTRSIRKPRTRESRNQRRAEVGKGGKMAGKWTSLAHIAPGSTRLGPDNLMQVVDFPHLSAVSQAKLGTNVGELGENSKGMEADANFSAKWFGLLRESSRSFAQIRAVVTRCLASQARHKLDAQVGCSLARNVVALLRIRQ